MEGADAETGASTGRAVVGVMSGELEAGISCSSDEERQGCPRKVASNAQEEDVDQRGARRCEGDIHLLSSALGELEVLGVGCCRQLNFCAQQRTYQSG